MKTVIAGEVRMNPRNMYGDIMKYVVCGSIYHLQRDVLVEDSGVGIVIITSNCKREECLICLRIDG